MESSRTSAFAHGCFTDAPLIPSSSGHHDGCPGPSSDEDPMPPGDSSNQNVLFDSDTDMAAPSDSDSNSEAGVPLIMHPGVEIAMEGMPSLSDLQGLLAAANAAAVNDPDVANHSLIQMVIGDSLSQPGNPIYTMLNSAQPANTYSQNHNEALVENNSEHSGPGSDEHGGAPAWNQEATHNSTIGSMLHNFPPNSTWPENTGHSANYHGNNSNSNNTNNNEETHHDEWTPPSLEQIQHVVNGINNGTNQNQQQQAQPQVTWPNLSDILNDTVGPIQYNPLITEHASVGVGTQNAGLFLFMDTWASESQLTTRGYGSRGYTLMHISKPPSSVTRRDLNFDYCDFQGLDWIGMGTERRWARKRRLLTYKNYCNFEESDNWKGYPLEERPQKLRSEEDFFVFEKMSIRQDSHLSHFQLRSLMASPCSSKILYATIHGLNMLNAKTCQTKPFIDLRQGPYGIAWDTRITALDARNDIVMAGTFHGGYIIKPLHSSFNKEYTEGEIIPGQQAITNNIQLFSPRRSSSPSAAICSNNDSFRVIDLTTQKFTQERYLKHSINCTRISPDLRLRAMVGDSKNALITDADTGQTLIELSGHRDNGFSCDWSGCGRYLATGFQDKSIKIWDCRKWTSNSGESAPITSLRCEMAGARNLRFSPLGSGPPVLVVAEEADFISIINAQTFDSNQQFDIFGEISGIDFSDEGRELNILCSDPHRGGILNFRRCEFGGLARSPALPQWDFRDRAWVEYDRPCVRMDWARRKIGKQACAASLPTPF